jgi:biopolymer transport protein ExbB/TolQ
LDQRALATAENTFALSWIRQDPENRLGFSGGRFTRVNTFLSATAGIVLAVSWYGLLLLFDETPFAAMFTERGFTPYVMVVLSTWSMAIILIKMRKLRLQERALLLPVVPESPDFVLSVTTATHVDERIRSLVDDPRKFVLLNRIEIALSSLRNLGRVNDIDEILRSQGETDESTMETSYALLRGFVWAIPILGFIGTVMGLSTAIFGFGQVLGENAELSQISSSLRVVTGGLATAFETTLLALVCALCIQLVVTFLKKREEEFLDACSEYCQRNIVSRLRVMPFESGGTGNEPSQPV